MKINIFTILIFTLFLSGCFSLMEKSGQFLDGTLFAQKTISVYRALEKDGAPANMEITITESKDERQSVIITIDKYPMIKIHSSIPDENGYFFLVSLDYFGNNVHGWNEYTLTLLGFGNLVLADTAVMENIKEIEGVQITSGRIHRYDTRLTRDDALTALRNRHERIKTLVEWMLSSGRKEYMTIKDFERFWKPVLLPEMVSKKNRPCLWQQETDIFQRADSIRWNTSYTERVFSGDLIPVRNSGTLLRDWEESLSWIYLEYEWENIKNILSQRIIFNKIK